MTEHKEETNFRDMFLRTIAVVGLMAVLLLGAWGIILIAVNLPNFFDTLSGSVSSLFTTEQEPQTTTTASATQETPAEQPASATANTAASAASTKTTAAVKSAPSAQYVASAKTYTALYGAADLAVRVISVTPAGGRTNIQFEIQNIGTNVTPTGWSFDAELPLSPSYTYRAAGQQPLYPGDKIIYTLGFNTPYTYNNWYCGQYSGYTCPQYNYAYNNQYPYNYYNYGTCYHYDGVANYTVPCPGVNYNPPYNTYSHSTYGYNYNYPYGYSSRLVTITVDPYSMVADYNRANNTASVAI